MEQRVRFVVRAESGAERLGALCEEFGIDRTTGWRWLKRRAEAGSIEELGEKSRRPIHSPAETKKPEQERVLALRKQYGWGGLKLEVMLRREGIELTVSTINRILRRHGVIAEEDSQQPARKRFEREKPNQLWQMDFKGVADAYAARHGRIYPLSILDDHSRYAVRLTGLKQPTGAAVDKVLISAFEECGVPKAMLMDQGVPWWAPSNGHGLTQLSVSLMKQGIRLYFSGIGRPQTQGKVERFHRTLEQQMQRASAGFPGWSKLLSQFRQEYNHVRPHQALGMETPAVRYQMGTRAYNPRPPRWEYEQGSVVTKLNSKGCVTYGSERYFVCEALSGEEVCVERLGGTVLVRYRHTYVREIDPSTRRTRPLVLPSDGKVKA
jgi:transposase InsO family protein